jgi:hypothetical protein
VCRCPARHGGAAIVLTLTFMRSCENGEHHLEVRVGNVETECGGQEVFAAVDKADTDLKALICRSMDAVRQIEGTALTAFTDGCPGLRRILADARRHHTADAQLVSHCYAAPGSEANSQRPVGG